MKSSDWIRVKDRLPRVNKGYVFVCCQDGEKQWLEFAILKREDTNHLIWRDVNGNLLSTVTYWQRIVFPRKLKKPAKVLKDEKSTK